MVMHLRFVTMQVIAKMKKTHTDLIHTIEADMRSAGFSDTSLQPLRDHKAAYGEDGEKNGEWFNNSDNYKAATNAVIEAKLEVYCGVLKSDSATNTEKDLAGKMLFSDSDSAALAKGIATILPHPPLLEKYQSRLAEIAEAGSSLKSLDLKDRHLSGILPDSVMTLMGSAEYFNMAGNSFSNVIEGTALHNMIYGMTNWRDRKELVWSGQNGGGDFASVPEQIRFFTHLVTLDLSSNGNLAGACFLFCISEYEWI